MGVLIIVLTYGVVANIKCHNVCKRLTCWLAHNKSLMGSGYQIIRRPLQIASRQKNKRLLNQSHLVFSTTLIWKFYSQNRNQPLKVSWSRSDLYTSMLAKTRGKMYMYWKRNMPCRTYLPGCSKLKRKQTHFGERHLLPLGGWAEVQLSSQDFDIYLFSRCFMGSI